MDSGTNRLAPMPKAMLDKLADLLAEQVDRRELNEIWKDLGIIDSTGGASRVNQVRENLSIEQARTRSSGIVAKFIELVLIPVRFVDRTSDFRRIRHDTNAIIAFHGWSLDERGKLVIVDRSESLSEAAMRANRVIAELRQRDTHEEVFKYCDQELLAEDLFHALHEAVKGLSSRLRAMSGLDLDGGKLFDACFGGNEPLLRINGFETENDRKIQAGFINGLKGAHGMWRNPTAHESRINVRVIDSELVDAMSLVSYLHKRLDGVARTEETFI